MCLHVGPPLGGFSNELRVGCEGTRFESLGTDINGELPDEEISLNVQPATLARDANWLPAVENRGEGVFLEFDASLIEQWAQRAEVQTRASVLQAGFLEWMKGHPGSKRMFPGAAYFMLHTFAHLVMTAISLECGYPASSLRERIYAMPAPLGGARRYGVLIYTGSSDAEGIRTKEKTFECRQGVGQTRPWNLATSGPLPGWVFRSDLVWYGQRIPLRR